jgi:hypothetical protein
MGGFEVPMRWRSYPLSDDDPVALRLSSIAARADIRESIRIRMYRSFPGDGMNASVEMHDGSHVVFISDRFRHAPTVATDIMLAHELGHIAHGDTRGLRLRDLPVAQARADAFAIRLFGEAAFIGGMTYAQERRGLNSFQGDLFALQIVNIGALEARRRLLEARPYVGG